MDVQSIQQGGFFTVEEGVVRAMDRAAFLQQAGDADYILIGEGHTSRCDHEAQATILRWLATAQPSGPPVALEMVGMDKQPQLDLFNQGEFSAHDLSVILDWERSWGHDFLAYGPVFAEASRHRLPLYAANLPQGAARAYGRGGVEAVAPAHRTYLPATIIPAGEPQREELRRVFEAHAAMMRERSESNATVEPPAAQNGTSDGTEKPSGGMVSAQDDEVVRVEEAGSEEQKGAMQSLEEDAGAPGSDSEAMFDRFITVQSLWDTVMADNAMRIREQEGAPVVVLAGSGHVDFGWGIALRLASLDPDGKVLLVAPWRQHPVEGLPPEGMGDVYFYCPLPPGTRMVGDPDADPESGDTPDTAPPSESANTENPRGGEGDS